MLKDFEFNLNKWHLLLILIIGFLATFFSFVVTAIWVIAIVFCLIGVFKKNCFIYVWYTIAMSPGLEIWGRMAKAPAIPWEIGKYFLFVVIIAMLFGNWEKRPLYKVGVYLIIAILPSLVIALINLPFNFENWLMHAAGILQIGILLLYTSRERISKINFIKILKISIIPIIPIVEYITIKTPKFNDVDFKLVANSQTTGGFGSNQVSTILGLGILILSILIFTKQFLFINNKFDYVLLFYFFFRGLLTFSRGGILSAVIAIIICSLILFWGNKRSIYRALKYSTLILFIGFFVAFFANKLTNNQLSLRYKGETEGTASGTREKTLNTITSSRSTIAETDIDIFLDHLLYGVGPGESQNFREQYGGAKIIAHVEYSRLLSEHGIGGLFVIVILTFFPFYWVKRIKERESKAIAAALFTFAILNSFHAAMRTNATTTCYIIAAIPLFINIPKILGSNKKEILVPDIINNA